jgi:hypothetical protein
MEAKHLLFLLLAAPLIAQSLITGLPGVDVSVHDHQVTITNNTQQDIIALQLFFRFANGRRMAFKLINWQEHRDPIVLRGQSLVIDTHDHTPKFDGVAIDSLSLDGVVFANGKLAGPDEYGLGALVNAKWRARRDIFLRFRELALSQHPSDAYSFVDREDWRKDTDGNYVNEAQVYYGELSRILKKHGLQAAVARADEYLAEAKGATEVTR